MSSIQELTSRKLEFLNVEIIDHLKRTGIYDEIRIGLVDPIWSDPCFQEDIVVRFIGECEKFCELVDLSLPRNVLRNKLAVKFEHSYSTSVRLVKSHIEKILMQRNEDVKSKYFQHARSFVSKFLPDIDTSHQVQEPDSIPTPGIGLQLEKNIEQESKQPTPPRIPSPHPNHESPCIESELVRDPETQVQDMDIDSEEDEIERPVYSPIGNDNSSMSPNDGLEQLTFSSVSSVDTDELSDFDNSIKLSDDEANIVGKPKNSKIALQDIQVHINDLQTTSAPSNNTRRNTRTRKSNSRYSNEDYKFF